MATVLHLRCIFILLDYIHVNAIMMQYFSYLDKREVLQPEYSQPPILPSPPLWRVVNRLTLYTKLLNLFIERHVHSRIHLSRLFITRSIGFLALDMACMSQPREQYNTLLIVRQCSRILQWTSLYMQQFKLCSQVALFTFSRRYK